MLAVVERVRLGGAGLLHVTAASLFAIQMLETREAPRPTHGYRCAHALPLAQAWAVTDRLYRQGDFENAECVLRVAADREEPAKREQLHLVAEFYHQLGH